MFKRVALIALVFVFCATAALAAQPAPMVDDSLPFFGGVAKTPAQQDHDKAVVAEAIKRAGSQEKAVQLVLQSGWTHLKGGDSPTAIKYFNLAWLIKPENPDVLWGFGAALGQQRKVDDSLRLYERAKAQKPGDGALLADYAYGYIAKGAMADKTPAARNTSFENALKLLAQAETLTPKNPLIYSNRAIVQYFKGQYAEAWKGVAQAEAIAPGSVDPKFLNDLSAKMPRPK